MEKIKYASVCSGVEAPTVAWHHMGWEPQWFCEFDKFPSAVLNHRYPSIPNLGDMTKLREKNEYHERSIDLLVGGTPCQSFSVAGLRKGLEDPRGNLALEFVRILQDKQPRWFVWENVPGVLSSFSGPKPPSDLEEGQEWEATETSDFTNICRAFTKVGYGIQSRVLDAQFFGVPQRRRRVFVVGYLGDWRPARRVLFESESLRWNIEESGKTRQKDPRNTRASIEGTGPLKARDGKGPDSFGFADKLIIHGTQDPCVSDKAFALGRNNGGENVVCGTQNDACRDASINIAPTLRSGSGGGAVEQVVGGVNLMVRKLTPVECERLQGFPDNYTQIPWRGKDAKDCPKGPRYKAMGNSMAVPVMKWIGERIEAQDSGFQT